MLRDFTSRNVELQFVCFDGSSSGVLLHARDSANGIGREVWSEEREAVTALFERYKILGTYSSFVGLYSTFGLLQRTVG